MHGIAGCAADAWEVITNSIAYYGCMVSQAVQSMHGAKIFEKYYARTQLNRLSSTTHACNLKSITSNLKLQVLATTNQKLKNQK